MQESWKTQTLENSLQGDVQVERINMNLAWFKTERPAGEGSSFTTAHSIGENDT